MLSDYDELGDDFGSTLGNRSAVKLSCHGVEQVSPLGHFFYFSGVKATFLNWHDPKESYDSQRDWAENDVTCCST